MGRTLGIIGGVFALVGLVAAAIGAWFVADAMRFRAGAERAEGVVVSAGSTPTVRFEAGGRTIEIFGRISSNPPSFRRGEKVTVLFRPEDPEGARIDSFLEQYFGLLFCGIFAVVFGGIGAGFLIVPAIGRRRRARAMSLGTPVKAKVTEVRLNTSVRVNGRSPWVIVAEWEDTGLGKRYAFTSHYLWADPSQHYPQGGEATVYYLPDEPRTYAFDLDKLPEVV